LVRSPEIDAVVVVTPNNLHYSQTMAALEQGKHVFCEKPLAMDLREAREMYEAAQRSGLVHMANFTFRGAPTFARMKELIDQGYAGNIYHIAVSFIGFFNRGDAMVWRRDRAQAGYGALGDLGSHAVDMARWMCGEIARVSGHLATVTPHLKLPDGKTVPNETDDTCAILLGFRSGAEGIIHASWTGHSGLAGMLLRVEVHGSNGMLVADTNLYANPRSWITLVGAQGDQKQAEPLPMPRQYTEGLDVTSRDALVRTLTRKPWYAAQRFVEALLGRREPSPSFFDGMRVQEVLDAAYASNQQGRWVDISPAAV
jgi:predicted dehydrogenase